MWSNNITSYPYDWGERIESPFNYGTVQNPTPQGELYYDELYKNLNKDNSLSFIWYFQSLEKNQILDHAIQYFTEKKDLAWLLFVLSALDPNKSKNLIKDKCLNHIKNNEHHDTNREHYYKEILELIPRMIKVSKNEETEIEWWKRIFRVAYQEKRLTLEDDEYDILCSRDQKDREDIIFILRKIAGYQNPLQPNLK
jgi:hypothetical protein